MSSVFLTNLLPFGRSGHFRCKRWAAGDGTAFLFWPFFSLAFGLACLCRLLGLLTSTTEYPAAVSFLFAGFFFFFFFPGFFFVDDSGSAGEAGSLRLSSVSLCGLSPRSKDHAAEDSSMSNIPCDSSFAAHA